MSFPRPPRVIIALPPKSVVCRHVPPFAPFVIPQIFIKLLPESEEGEEEGEEEEGEEANNADGRAEKGGAIAHLRSLISSLPAGARAHASDRLTHFSSLTLVSSLTLGSLPFVCSDASEEEQEGKEVRAKTFRVAPPRRCTRRR